MRIQTNLLAQNADRQIKIITDRRKKSTEKLSSGYRVNNAADDAAVLTISEKMRAQIRGLNQGSNNISDGISLIQVAEGAMGEVTSIIQRMRELTVKSYNGTLTQDDRLACQFEADSLLEELDRIAESTEFNTIKVFQGGAYVEKLVKAGEVSVSNVPIFNSKELPSWVSGDSKLLYNNGKVDSSNKQNLTDIMIKNEGLPNEEIWGSAATDSDKKWTESLADNASAVLDFSSLATLDNRDDILEHLSSLVATGVGLPCSTCVGIKNGFYFVTNDMKDTNVVDSDASQYGKVNLDAMMLKVSESKAVSAAEFNALAKDVAKELTNAVLESTKDFDHFDNFKKLTNHAGSETYSIVVYDFRDKRATDPVSAENNIDRALDISFSVPIQMIGSDFYETVQEPVVIQAGASGENGNRIEVYLPKLSRAFLGLEKYSVFKDRGYSSLTDLHYLEENYKSLYEIDKTTGKYTIKKGKLDPLEKTYTETKIIDIGEMKNIYHPGKPATTNDVGERIPAVPPRVESIFIKTGERTETRSYTYYERNGDENVLVYEPSDIKTLDNALDCVLDWRSSLGAKQNRLDYAKKINDNSSENLQSAESKMRDTNMAAEIMQKSKDDILSQVGQSLLAQANKNPENILYLLQL